mmetsp:Transcript_24028/g.77350  ORF Transcript_24028/g.77350 Transcript_24028/m.77350 type:complete len:297 (-) Transcript_24028:887-1777(-)
MAAGSSWTRAVPSSRRARRSTGIRPSPAAAASQRGTRAPSTPTVPTSTTTTPGKSAAPFGPLRRVPFAPGAHCFRTTRRTTSEPSSPCRGPARASSTIPSPSGTSPSTWAASSTPVSKSWIILPKNKEGSKSSAPQVYAEESGSFVAWNATFDSNQAGYGDVPTSWGGVAALLDGSTFAAHDSSFTSNYAGDAGGVFDVETSSALELTSSTVEANSCGDVGGVIYAVFSSRIHVEDTTFKDNKAHDAAVAFIFVSSTFVAERSRFEGNDARNYVPPPKRQRPPTVLVVEPSTLTTP